MMGQESWTAPEDSPACGRQTNCRHVPWIDACDRRGEVQAHHISRGNVAEG